MKKYFKKLGASILLVSMLVGNSGFGTVLAEELSYETQQNHIQSEEIQSAEDVIDFLYIESPYLEAPGTQRIVVSICKEIEMTDEVSLIVSDEYGKEEEWKLSKRIDTLCLFEKAFEESTLAGTYAVTDIVFFNHEDGMRTRISLSDSQIEAKFGVNEEYQGSENLVPVDDSVAPEIQARTFSSESVDISVVSLDEIDENSTSEKIEETLESAEVQQEELPQICTTLTEEKTKSEDLVIALDPGHDARDAGASGHGLREEDLTLKIANYCKAELEQYCGVKVYMTRTTAACPYDKPGISCMEDRVKAASQAGAKYFISFHLNSSVASGAHGAEIIIPNANWKPELHTNGKALAEKILAELVQLGLAKRSIYYKDTTISEKYPDGSKSDYFTVQICCKENDMTGLIVEHAFLSNTNDVNRFLKTEEGLKSLGVADATGIAKYFSLSKGNWEFVSGEGWKYYTANGYLKDSWKMIGGKKYHFDQNGIMQTGWQTIDEKRYYFQTSGEMQTGWLLDNGVWYYLDTDGQMTTGWKWVSGWYYMNEKGEMQTGWLSLDNSKYYLNSSGTMVTGWQTIEGNQYYFNGSGCMQTGIQTIKGEKFEFAEDGKLIGKSPVSKWVFTNGIWYYYNSEGKKATGWQWIRGWYYMNEKGEMQTGWLSLDNSKYYLNSSGTMVTGWQTIEGNQYYFNGSGCMQTGIQTIQGEKYEFAEDGKLIKKLYTSRWVFDNGIWYYYNSKGEKATGWQWISGWYYLNEKGEMQTGWQYLDGKWYYLNGSGLMLTGWRFLGGSWYYLNGSGVMLIDWQYLGGRWYYMNGSGAMQTGWKYIREKWYYMNGSGAMLTGWQYLGGSWYYLSGSGAMLTGWQYLGGSWYYLSGSGAMLTGTQTIGGKVYTFASDGKWY